MTLEDKPAFVQLLSSLAELYSKPLSQYLHALYWHVLEGFEFKEIRRAFSQHLLNPDGGKFMPKPADLVGYLEGDYQTRALRAWSKVLYGLQHAGVWDSVVFDDSLIHRVITDMGGWQRLCRTLEVDLTWRQQEFEKRYRGYLLQRPTHHHPSHLVGYLELQRRLYGYPVQSLRLLGDPQLA